MSKNFLTAMNSAVKSSTLSSVVSNGSIRLSDIIFIEIDKLHENTANTLYFKTEDPEKLRQLKKDIAERGILVPLIAKKDYTLLAGHNRLKIAKELNLVKVPVQIVENDLSETDERTFLIKDNLLRRQLSQDEWIELYKILFPNFEERITSIDNPLTNKEIAEQTGQSVEAVKKQIQRSGLRKKSDSVSKGTLSPATHSKKKNLSLTKKEEQVLPDFTQATLRTFFDILSAASDTEIKILRKILLRILEQ